MEDDDEALAVGGDRPRASLGVECDRRCDRRRHAARRLALRCAEVTGNLRQEKLIRAGRA